MSKRQSTQSNTLFDYFQSPKRQITNNAPGTSKGKSNSNLEDSTGKTEEDFVGKENKKFKRVRVIDSDSDDEKESRNVETPAKARKLSNFSKQSSTPKSEKNSENGSAEYNVESTPKTNIDVNLNVDSQWVHHRLDFLKPEKIRDIKKNKPGHAEYDERTLFVPEDFLNKQTPAMRQWWLLKSKHYDSVLFFKVGKFYELYHMDAVIGVKHLGFSYMKGEFAHSGFPESAYGRMASSLIEQGFKVARVEQTETPEMMQERCKTMKKSGKFDKVVNREICQVSTKGTCIYGAQMTEAKRPASYYMIAIAEKQTNRNNRFGVCFIDTSIGTFSLSEFDDDKHCSRLLTLLAEHPPALFLLERTKISGNTLAFLKKHYGDIKKDMLSSESQFYGPSKTIDQLASASYFLNENGELEWPQVLKQVKDNSDYTLALKALGACIWYLKDSELDLQVVCMKKFEIYQPIDTSTAKKDVSRDYMVLDSITMDNLKLLGGVGTIQKTLDRCHTAFGRRLLQQWICRPLCNVDKLTERQKAISELVNNPEMLQQARAILKKLPDLERQVAKIHIFGNKHCAKSHPDSRAIFYEAKTYSKRKIFDLLNTLRGFEKAQELASVFQGCESRFLRKITQPEPAGFFTDITDILHFFKDAFDHKEAEKEGKIIPQAGLDRDYDEAVEKINKLHEELDQYLEGQRKFFGCKVTYFGNDKKRFQLDIPENKTYKVTSEYRMEGTKKGSKRYSTAVTRSFLSEMLQREAERTKIIQDLNRRIFEKFSAKGDTWDKLVQCLKILDVLCSLAEFARTYPEEVCLPGVHPFVDNPRIKITDGRHPSITNITTFVPNDTFLGTDDDHSSILLLTGPNMGGKSTLMRQVAVITIMAQIGSYVPASSCELNLVDRIFTRLGAHDDILQGQSTFLVELSEASAILQHATCHSFVLLDELGRGTSTHDGNAIATAYVRKLTEMKCRTMFSTHYHNLVDYYADYRGIQLGNMACMVEREDVNDAAVTFLYKLSKGRCPKSYGFNVARLAAIPQNITARANEVARTLERLALNRQIISNIFNESSISERRKLIASLH